jgi:hypothetical protein
MLSNKYIRLSAGHQKSDDSHVSASNIPDTLKCGFHDGSGGHFCARVVSIMPATNKSAIKAATLAMDRNSLRKRRLGNDRRQSAVGCGAAAVGFRSDRAAFYCRSHPLFLCFAHIGTPSCPPGSLSLYPAGAVAVHIACMDVMNVIWAFSAKCDIFYRHHHHHHQAGRSSFLVLVAVAG